MYKCTNVVWKLIHSAAKCNAIAIWLSNFLHESVKEPICTSHELFMKTTKVQQVCLQSASVSENGREFPTVGQKTYVSAANLGLVFIKIKLKNPLI